MAGGEGRISKVDFAQFWERQWKKNFDITPPLFKGEVFASMFEEDTREAMQLYIHFQVHPVTTAEDREQLNGALLVLKNKKINPKKIIEGRSRAGVARLP